MRKARQALALTAMWLFMSGAANGYYYFVHYFSRTAPFVPVPEKFDLDSLTNKTLPYLISEQGPTTLGANDSMASVVSQIRLAAKAWNDVPSSDLRLGFGGFFSPGTTYSRPAVEVVFEDLPPGLLGQGGPTLLADPATRANGQFVPILRSTVRLNRDLSQHPSFSEGFFLTVAHEIGHALGLQHSLTSSVMSTQTTRATTKSQPLAADDVAGLSLLYPAPGWLATRGSISGRVALGATGVHLASVVALSPEGLAISAMTNPDGTYRIEGLPPGSYYVYAHPLPPSQFGETYPANVIPPVDSLNSSLPATTVFETLYYPGTKDASRALIIPVGAGNGAEGVNFGVTRRATPAVYGISTYSFPGQVAVRPAHLSTAGGRSFILAFGAGLTANTGVSVLGASAVIPQGGVKPYSQDPRFVQMDFQFTPFSGEGARHLTFQADNDLYVLPAGFRLTRTFPPSVNSVARYFNDAVGNPQVVVSGTGFNTGTQILFDGVAGSVRGVDEAAGTMIVAPPQAGSRHKAAVVAVNRDGQSSLFLQGSSPTMFEFDTVESGSFVVSPMQIPAGTDAMVEVAGAGTNFQPGTTVAFGSGDVHVRRIWVTGPNRLLVNVVVAPSASPGPLNVTVVNGLRILNAPAGFQVVADHPAQTRLHGPVVDQATGFTDIQAGAVASLRLSGPAAELPPSAIQLSVNDKPVSVVSLSGGVLQFRVPADLSPGPAVLRIIANGETALPIVMSIDLPPPVVNSIQIGPVKIDEKRPARAGELLTVSVARLAETGSEVDISRVRILVGAILHSPVLVSPAAANGSYSVQFLLDSSISSGSLPLSIRVDNRRISDAVTLHVQ